MKEMLLKATGVKKGYGESKERTQVLDGLELSVREGEFISVMGPSGSGKSTLLFVLSGMDKLDAGEVIFEGKALKEMTDDQLADLRRRRMGFVFQQPTLLRGLNILDNILLPALKDRDADLAALKSKAMALMEEMGIAHLADREITEASGGELQRAGICRALINDPRLLFADEPTGALNTRTAEEVMALFARIHGQGHALFMVTHDPKVAAHAQRVVFMKNGALVSQLAFTDEAPGSGGRAQQVRERMQELGI